MRLLGTVDRLLGEVDRFDVVPSETERGTCAFIVRMIDQILGRIPYVEPASLREEPPFECAMLLAIRGAADAARRITVGDRLST